jgi:hypothetical protein
MVKQTDDSVSSLTSVRCLINEVVDPAWYPFTTNPKDGTLPCCLEYIGPGWRGVLQMMDLLGKKIERVMHASRPTCS